MRVEVKYILRRAKCGEAFLRIRVIDKHAAEINTDIVRIYGIINVDLHVL